MKIAAPAAPLDPTPPAGTRHAPALPATLPQKTKRGNRIYEIHAALRGLPLMTRVVVLETALQKLRQKLHDQEDEFRRRVEKEPTT